MTVTTDFALPESSEGTQNFIYRRAHANMLLEYYNYGPGPRVGFCVKHPLFPGGIPT